MHGKREAVLHQRLEEVSMCWLNMKKVKRITMPLGKNHLLYLSTEVQADHDSIIHRTLELLAQKQDY
jgi:hypothetical protein